MEKRRIFITKKGWLWNLGGDVSMGVMGSVSVNLQVRLFCNYFLLFLLVLILPFFPSFVRLSVSLILLLVLFVLSMFSHSPSFTAFPLLLHFWHYHGRTETQATAPTLSFLRPTTISSADG
jgi:hypothetical protein